MPRAGIRPEDRSTGGLFTFEEGNGEIVNAMVCNHSIPGFDPSCVFKLSIQRLDANWNPTADEPIDEFLNVGSVTKFHPGNAKSSDDHSDALEFGGAADCGDQDEAEGTCLLSLTGKGPNDSQNLKFKAKINIFADSCLAHGVKPGLFNGYAPNLIGMKAHFTQMMLPKSAEMAIAMEADEGIRLDLSPMANAAEVTRRTVVAGTVEPDGGAQQRSEQEEALLRDEARRAAEEAQNAGSGGEAR